MTTSNRLFRNNSTIYIATAQSPIFSLLRIIQSFCYCATLKYLSPAYRQIISTLQIVYLFGYCAQKNCRTTSNCLFGNISTIYMAPAQSPIFRLLRIYHFATAHLRIIYLLQIDNYFTTGNRLHNCLLCVEKFCGNFKSPIWKHINNSYGYYAKHNFLPTQHLSFC